VIAHTRRDARLLRDLHGIREATHHPLAFVRPSDAATIRAGANRDAFPLLRGLPPQAKLIGTFGFLSPYKGFETAMQALHLLPEDHHLLVFGGVHPQGIARHQPIDPYVERLLQTGRIGQSVLDGLRAPDGEKSALALDGSAAALLAAHPQDLRKRVHFMGVLDDAEFCTAMAICDAVVLPYLEVGQTSSGPISMALDMGCRVIASRNRAFLQLSRYHPDEIEFFDIGNYAELAARIAADPPFDRRDRVLAYNTDTNAALYLRLHRPQAATKTPAMATAA
jgi:glycosyltransferase involved in cell wall biosynthesis